MYVLKNDTLLAQAAIDIATAGPFETPKICLYTNDVYPARNMALTDFTRADFGGLTNVRTVTLGVPFLNDLSQAEVRGALVAWLTTATTGLPITAYGYLLLNAAGSDWLLGERFAEPWVFARAGQSEALVPRLVWE